MPDTQPSTMTVPAPPEASVQPGSAACANHDALPPGTRLDEFEIVRVLGVGGFGIVYLALDHVLQRQVAVKEYLPGGLAGRGDGLRVDMRSAALAETFQAGLESFFAEARLLASFDHPSLVRVHRFWKANGTAYMAMPYYPGRTLKEARRAMTRAPDEGWLRAFVDPLLSALELLHRAGVYHRDITPDNILLLADGRTVLLDFGAARRHIGDRTQALTAVLKPNFAPVEQYADVVGMRQGPWTDLYALGATVHFMLVGTAPMPAVLRAVRDTLPALSVGEAAAQFPGVSTGFLAAVDWALALAPGDRPQSVDALRQALSGAVVPPPPKGRLDPEPELPPIGAPAGPASGDLASTAVPTAAPEGAPARAGARQASVLGTRLAMAGAVLLSLITLGWSTQVFDSWGAATPSAAVAPMVATAPPQAEPLAGNATNATPSASVAPPASRPGGPVGAGPARERTLAQVGPTSPKAACGDINFIALAMCLGRECATSRWHSHPQCVELRQADEQRRRRMEQQ